MSYTPLARFAGPLALAAGALITVTQLVAWAIASSVDRGDPGWRETLLTDPVYVANGVAFFAAYAVLLVALVAVYERQASRAGIFGAIGVSAALVGTVFMAGDYWYEGFVNPWIAGFAPETLDQEPSGILLVGGGSTSVLFSLGWLLFGLASLRAQVLPRAISAAIAISGLIGFVTAPPFGLPLGLAVGAMGLWLVWRRGASVPGDGHASPIESENARQSAAVR